MYPRRCQCNGCLSGCVPLCTALHRKGVIKYAVVDIAVDSVPATRPNTKHLFSSIENISSQKYNEHRRCNDNINTPADYRPHHIKTEVAKHSSNQDRADLMKESFFFGNRKNLIFLTQYQPGGKKD